MKSPKKVSAGNHALMARLISFIQDYDSSDSFCLVPSKSEPSSSTLKKENASLRSELEAMQKQLEAAERMLKLRKEQDQQLRDNIAVARREVRFLDHAVLCTNVDMICVIRRKEPWELLSPCSAQANRRSI